MVNSLISNNKILHDSTKLSSSKYFQSIINNSIKHQLFVYSWLHGQRLLFLTIQFSINHLFATSLNIKVLFDPLIRPNQGLPYQVRVDLGAIAIKGF